MAIATDGCNVIGRHNFLVQKLEGKIVSLVSVHCHAHRCASASYYTAADLYSMVYELRKHFKAIMEVLCCFTVAIGLLAMPQTTMKTKGRQLQRVRKTRWLSSEATVRVGSENLAIWAAPKLSEDKYDAMCVVLLRLVKTKKFNMVPSYCQHDTTSDRTEQSFSGGMI